MADQLNSKVKISTIIHLILYTLLIGSLAGGVYWTYENMENEIGQRVHHAVKERLKQLEIDQAKNLEQTSCTELEQTNLQLQSDLNQTKIALMTLQEAKPLEQKNEPISESKPMQDQQVCTEAKMIKESLSCYSMYQGSYFMPARCKAQIKNYVDRHKDAKYFEIVGIVDNLDFELFAHIEKHPELYDTIGLYQEGIDELKKFSQAGLAKYRAMEASWIIKSYTKKSAVTYNANYQLVSKSGQKGFLVRAYK